MARITIKKGHGFNFDGGEYLAKIGASWFVSYCYYLFIDKKHENWKNIRTFNSRIGVYNRTKNYHEFWLSQIESMNNDLLNKNKIELDASATKRMANSLLKLIRQKN